MPASFISMTSNDIRKRFLDFFASKGHTIVPSSPLVPGNDPTLLFTNAGMVQFKDVFLGLESRPYVRAASSQRCVRAGGKHNDLENVGYTARHHTFFEMLGNFSFGDYFKRDAIQYAWEFLTRDLRLPAEKLWVTVYQEDGEAYDIWANEIGVPKERIVRIGDNKGAKYASDNFWQMGDTGPCGPCTEIFYDHGPGIAGGPPGSPDEDGDRYIEIWNNVFMQFNRDETGVLHPLPKPSVDTGMGLERISAVLQHVHSNYEIDLFQALIKAAARETGCSDLTSPSLKVIADHIRACAFLIVDGVIPGNEGRGYVLRRIIRRALRHGHKLGQSQPFFHKLVGDLAEVMGDAYPELRQAQTRVNETLLQEEIRFGETLQHGMTLLELALAGGEKILDGETAFRLYDTYGFPLDLTADVCRERNIGVDEAGFNAAMERQREQARAAGKFKAAGTLEYSGQPTSFHGYDSLNIDTARITAIYVEGSEAGQISAGQAGIIVLDNTPFYAESGGQVGDTGLLEADGARFEVADTQKIRADVFGHQGKLVQQKGSLVDPDKTRFDFSHTGPMTAEQIREVESLVNAEILQNQATQARVLPMDEARKLGAMMLFGEKYGDTVRVLDIGSSRELCGGTHVARTGDIGLFKIVIEGGVAAGIRRVEAVTGDNALLYLQNIDSQLHLAAAALKSQPAELPQKIAQIQDQMKSLEKELARFKAKLAASQGDDLASQALTVAGVKILAAQIEGDAQALRETADKLRDKLQPCALVLGSVAAGKVSLTAMVSPSVTRLIKAGELVNFVAAQVGGKGGGRPDMAQAGGTEPDKLATALASVSDWAASKLK
jgi:alanyl-tRNA synthetase